MAWRAGFWPTGRLLHTPGLKCLLAFCSLFYVFVAIHYAVFDKSVAFYVTCMSIIVWTNVASRYEENDLK